MYLGGWTGEAMCSLEEMNCSLPELSSCTGIVEGIVGGGLSGKEVGRRLEPGDCLGESTESFVVVE